ncbi:verprolin-like [Echeneis naucrates]|uniref:verprolin-like n=1 Tax=Echeneis naucrates TaxID=173247 RepID=UPI001113BA83|nr:verprolin-like [Echeneis naucrates]
MGNFSSKDGHGLTGAHGDSFHTPPASPQSDVPPFMAGVPQLLHPTSPQPSLAAPVSPPPPIPAIISVGKKSQPTTPTTPSSSSPAPDWRPPNSSKSSTTVPGVGPSVSPVHNKPGTAVVKGNAVAGRNGGPPTSTPRPPGAQGKTVAVSPTKSPSSLCSASPSVGSSSGQDWRERDSGLSQSSPAHHEAGDSRGEELEKLLEECRSSLDISDPSTEEILKHLLTEVKTLKSTLQVRCDCKVGVCHQVTLNVCIGVEENNVGVETEVGNGCNFQDDLQVAVSVADRLRQRQKRN